MQNERYPPANNMRVISAATISNKADSTINATAYFTGVLNATNATNPIKDFM